MRYSAEEIHDIAENCLKEYMSLADGDYDRILEDAQYYSLSAGGKRIRPCILLSVCQMLGGDISSAKPYAAALEYIHTYSLIHDDLPAMDNDDMRRGKPSNHKVYGEDMAILAGDGLLTQAFSIMSEGFLSSPDEHKIQAIGCIAACAYDMVKGQVADIRLPEDKDGSYFEYVHRNKTAALFIAAFTAGAYLAHADESVTEDMKNAGKLYGLAFQLKDDIEDLDTDEEYNFAAFLGKDEAVKRAEMYIKELKDILDKYDNSEVLKEILGI